MVELDYVSKTSNLNDSVKERSLVLAGIEELAMQAEFLVAANKRLLREAGIWQTLAMGIQDGLAHLTGGKIQLGEYTRNHLGIQILHRMEIQKMTHLEDLCDRDEVIGFRSFSRF